MLVQIISLEPKILSSTITQEELNEIKSQELLEYLKSIDKIFKDKERYDYIYISIGCKKNEQFINIKKTRSNSEYQMFPQFLMNFKNPLVLLIDNFKFKYDDMENMAIIQNWAKSKGNDMESFRKTDDEIEINRTVYIIDYLFELNSLIELIKKLFINLDNYNPQKWMVCNYIRFKNEYLSNIEMRFYNKYIDNLKELYYDERYNKYFTNLYMWNGYQRFLTDVITQFEYIYIKNNRDIVFLKLDQKYNNNLREISITDILEYLYQYNTKYNLDKKNQLNDDFFKHSIDITKFYNFKEQNQNHLFSIYETLKFLNDYY
jgi:hypothetical protein